jgi:hypothetical protein
MEKVGPRLRESWKRYRIARALKKNTKRQLTDQLRARRETLSLWMKFPRD